MQNHVPCGRFIILQPVYDGGMLPQPSTDGAERMFDVSWEVTVGCSCIGLGNQVAVAVRPDRKAVFGVLFLEVALQFLQQVDRVLEKGVLNVLIVRHLSHVAKWLDTCQGLRGPLGHMSLNNKLAELSKSEVVQKLQSAYGTAKRYRAEAKHASAIGIRSIVVTAGGALGGALAVKYAFVPGTQLRTDVALGSACVTAAALDMAPESLADLGAGLLALAAGRETAKYFVAQARKAGSPVADITI